MVLENKFLYTHTHTYIPEGFPKLYLLELTIRFFNGQMSKKLVGPSRPVDEFCLMLSYIKYNLGRSYILE